MNDRILVFEISGKEIDAVVDVLGARRTDLSVILPDDAPRLIDLAREGLYDLVLMNSRAFSQIPRMVRDIVIEGACGGPVVIYRDAMEIDAVRSLMCRRHRCANHPRTQGWGERSASAPEIANAFALAAQEPAVSQIRGGRAATELSAGSYRLSRRQKEILRLLADGFSNREIATELGIQESTVKVQLKNVYRELKVKNRAQAASLVTRELSEFVAGNLN